MKENKNRYLLIYSFIIALFYKMPYLRHDGNLDISFLDKLETFFASYSIENILIFSLSVVLLLYAFRLGIKPTRSNTLLAFLYACFWSIGELYCSEYGWAKVMENIFRIILCIFSITLLLRFLIALLDHFLYAYLPLSGSKDSIILGKQSMLFSSCILFLSWIPFMLLLYPGSIAGDTLYQIWQINGEIEYWAHTPLFHTLCLKVFLDIGTLFFHSQTIGFFLCTISQGIFMALVLGYSLKRLYERNCPLIIRRILFMLYLLTPAYSNMVTTPGKDLAFMGIFLWYILLFEKITYSLAHGKEKELKIPFWILFVIVQVTASLVRKNGVYVIIPTGLYLAFVYAKEKGRKTFLLLLLTCCILPFLGQKATQLCLEHATNAKPASIREVLSIPFQQTARYLNVYGNEISSFEKEAIDTVLLDASMIGRIYTPDISDPVKMNYNENATTSDLINYFRAWFIGLKKHPIVYFDAFFQHVYGWFYPGADNVVRYEVEQEYLKDFDIPPFMQNSRVILDRLYEMNGKIPFLSLLENMGLYTWLLFYLLIRKGNTLKEKSLLVPMLLSLLICMASPAFYGHPRYGYPILVSLPFIFAILWLMERNKTVSSQAS